MLLMNPEEYVRETQLVLRDKVSVFHSFPKCVKNIINYKLWSKVKNREGNFYASFEDLCGADLPEGLQTNINDLLIYLKDTPEIKALVLNELGEIGQHGGNNNPQGIGGKSHKTSKKTSKIKNSLNGTSKVYLIKRLKRDNPEILEKLLNNEITVNQAAKDAGIRKPYAQIRTDNLSHAIGILKKYYNEAEIIQELSA